jgi:predicted outer membrane repeat protein
MVSAGSVTLTPSANPGYVFAYYLVNGVREDTLTALAGHSQVQAVFGLEVNKFTDEGGAATTPGTLRYALTNAVDGDAIVFTGVTPGTTEITLTSGLPSIASPGKSLVIEGNGITLACGDVSMSSGNVLTSNGGSATIRRVHFKGGRSWGNTALIRSGGTLILESCVFSDNRPAPAALAPNPNSSGGAIHSSAAAVLTLRGCTFYGNSAGYYGGAVYALGKLTMVGNLFALNSADSGYPVVYSSGTLLDVSCNVTDTPLGTGSADSGWAPGAGDLYSSAIQISGKTFRLLPGSVAANAFVSPPPGYPKTDFYGNPVGTAAGAAQAAVSGGGYYLGLSVNNSRGGVITVSPPPDGDDMVPAGAITITPAANSGYFLLYYLVNGTQEALPATLTGHTRVEAVFALAVTDFNDYPGSSVQGTLRYALTNLSDEDTILSFDGVTPGVTEIVLESNLPTITRGLIIEGNGITLTSNATRRLLTIDSREPVTIRRVHFKGGQATSGGAINDIGPLTLESCIFSGNQSSSTSVNTGGGAIYHEYSTYVSSPLTIRGCTFYGNSAGYQGGAVYSWGSSVLLTGNLFYGNTGGSQGYPVVNGSGGAFTASYNLVDVGLGSGSTLSGWTAGQGDKTTLDDEDGFTVEGAPFDTTSFAPVSALQNFLTTSPDADFPPTDFYGAARSFPGAPGAVSR